MVPATLRLFLNLLVFCGWLCSLRVFGSHRAGVLESDDGMSSPGCSLGSVISLFPYPSDLAIL